MPGARCRLGELSFGSFDYAQDARKEARIFGLIKSAGSGLFNDSVCATPTGRVFQQVIYTA